MLGRQQMTTALMRYVGLQNPKLGLYYVALFLCNACMCFVADKEVNSEGLMRDGRRWMKRWKRDVSQQ